jgi:hypothetical protein
MGRADPDEHELRVAARTAALKPARERLANIRRKRHPLVAAALPADQQFPAAPVDVSEPKRSDLAGAQPQPREQGDDHVIATPDPCTSIARGQQSSQRSRVQGLDRSDQSPARDRWDRAGQLMRDLAVDVQEPQEHPQPGDHALRRTDRRALRFAQHERAHRRRVEPLEVEPALGRLAPGQERARDADIVPDGQRHTDRHSRKYVAYRLTITSTAVTGSVDCATGTTPNIRRYSNNGTSARGEIKCTRPDARRAAITSSEIAGVRSSGPRSFSASHALTCPISRSCSAAVLDRYPRATNSTANPGANDANGPTISDRLLMTLSLLVKPKRESLDQPSELCREITTHPQPPQAISTAARHNTRLGISLPMRISA